MILFAHLDKNICILANFVRKIRNCFEDKGESSKDPCIENNARILPEVKKAEEIRRQSKRVFCREIGSMMVKRSILWMEKSFVLIIWGEWVDALFVRFEKEENLTTCLSRMEKCDFRVSSLVESI